MHDSVQAVLRDPAFRRALRNSLADRLLLQIGEWINKVGRLFRHLPSAKGFGLGVAALIVLYVVVRFVMAARADVAGRAGRALPRPGQAGGDDPWHAADALAESGLYEDAAHALYRGVIVSIGRSERLRLDPSRTSGDYARELWRRNAPSLAPFRAFTRRFDVAVYGYGGCDADAYGELRALAVPFRERAKAA